jgi:glycerol kinase
MLPQVAASSEVYAHTSEALFKGAIPISGIAGDQQAALFGQMCTQAGMVKNTYGTGCFMLMNIGDKPIISKNKLLTTVAWKIGNKTTYALEGSIFMAGAIVQWLRDGLKIIESAGEISALASSVPDTDGVCFVPAFAGLGAPYWNMQAKGSLFGMSRGTTDAHIARAALESIAMQTMDVLKAMEADAKIGVRELRVDGGAAINELLMKFQADVLQTHILRPKITETTAMGAAFLAGLAVGFWESEKEIQSLWAIDKKYKPNVDWAERDTKIKAWQRAVKATEFWAAD